MKIAISGCGIAGTAVAAMLAEAGHELTIFEQAAECRSVGAGILLQPSGQAVLQRMGLLEEIENVSARLNGLTARHQSGRSLVQLNYSQLKSPVVYGLGVHRGTLFQSLLNRCQAANVSIRNGAQVQSYRANPELTIQLANGEIITGFDFLIAADGSRSPLRPSTRIPFRVIEYDYAALWMTGHCESVSDHLLQVVDGTHRLLGLLPIGNGHCSFFWGLPASEYESFCVGDLERWKDETVDFCPLATQIVDSIESPRQLTFARYRHVMMQRSYCDRIIFLGDAAHATSPHLGQGVNLALEDAEVFATALQQTKNFETAARQFEQERRKLIRYYQTVTRLLTPFFQSNGRVRGWGRDMALPWFPRVPWVRTQMLRTLCGIKRGWLK